MTLKYVDRVLETSTTGGTGTLNLLGPQTAFRSFSLAGNGAKVSYVIDDGTLWEIGIGTVGVGSPNTLARGANPIASSNSNALVNFGTNVKNVRISPISLLMMSRDENLNFTDLLGTVGGSANAHTVAMPVTSLGYTNGMMIMYRAPAANTAASVTVNVDSLGVKNLKINGADPGIGAIASGALIVAVYNTATGFFDVISTGFLPVNGGNMIGAVNDAKSADIASAATTDLSTSTGNYVTITGTTTITALGILQAGAARIVRFAGALTLTYNATSLILPGGTNIITATGDMAEFVSEGAGNWRCIDYQKANGAPVVGSSPFTAGFESAEQAVTASGNISVAHGLTGQPKSYAVTLRCKTAELGYSVGDEVHCVWQYQSGGVGLSTWCNSANIGVALTNTPAIIHKTSNTLNSITVANWKWVLRAWL